MWISNESVLQEFLSTLNWQGSGAIEVKNALTTAALPKLTTTCTEWETSFENLVIPKGDPHSLPPLNVLYVECTKSQITVLNVSGLEKEVKETFTLPTDQASRLTEYVKHSGCQLLIWIGASLQFHLNLFMDNVDCRGGILVTHSSQLLAQTELVGSHCDTSIKSVASKVLPTSFVPKYRGTASENCELLWNIVVTRKIVEQIFETAQVYYAPVNEVLQFKRTKLSEFMMIHVYHSNGHIIRGNGQDFVPAGEEAKLEGGSFFSRATTPQHPFCAVLDVVSMYPSIIGIFNLCFSSLTPHMLTTFNTALVTPDAVQRRLRAMVTQSSIPVGPLAQWCRYLVQERVRLQEQLEVLMSSESTPAIQQQIQQIKLRRTSLKLCANSLYGCIGNSKFRFGSVYIANYITATGRAILTLIVREFSDKSLALHKQWQVVAGATDSIFIKAIGTFQAELDSLPPGADQYYAMKEHLFQIIEHLQRQLPGLSLNVEGIFASLITLTTTSYSALPFVVALDTGSTEEQIQFGTKCLINRGFTPDQRGVAAFVKELRQILLMECHLLRAGMGRKGWITFESRIRDHVRRVLHYVASGFVTLEELEIVNVCNEMVLPVSTKEFISSDGQYASQPMQYMLRISAGLNGVMDEIVQGQTVGWIMCHDPTSYADVTPIPTTLVRKWQLQPNLEWYVKTHLVQSLSELLSPLRKETDMKTFVRDLVQQRWDKLH